MRRKIISDSHYNDNAKLYLGRLSTVINRKYSFDPNKVGNLIHKEYKTPYGITMMAGYPLFRSPKMNNNYTQIIKRLSKITPNQLFYPIDKTHISLNVTIRIDHKIKHNSHIPSDNSELFYKDYINIIKNITFSSFSLKACHILPHGIILWKPNHNPEELFNIRKQIVEMLVNASCLSPNFDNIEGQPIIPDIIHTTFMRPFDIKEFKTNYQAYFSELEKINTEIKNGALFNEPLEIDEIALFDDCINSSVNVTSPNDFFNKFSTKSFGIRQNAR